MQPPLDIPARASSSQAESPRLIFGSPEMLNNYSDADSILGPSTPMLSSQALSTSSPRRRIGIPPHNVSTQTPPAHPHERFPERQWSLFGQLMENEGFLPLSPQSTRRDSENDYFARGTSSTSGLSPRPANIGPSYAQASSRDTSRSRTHNVVNDSTTHEYDTDDYSSVASTYLPPTPVKRSWFSSLPFGQFSLPTAYRNILKCSIAYFLASLFTFSPLLSGIISDMDSSPSASGHMVATIAVYFNPAKTVGAMLEADLFCLLGLLYATVVCLASMSMFWWLEVKPGWEWMADIVALVWIALSVGAMAWMKVWMENPSFNTGKACSMTAIIIFFVVIKEGGLSALIQVSAIVVCGSVTSNLVCYLLWPQSAISNLQLSMTQTLESFSTILPMLTRSFMLENDASSHIFDMENLQRAVQNHQNSFTTLQKNLREAKSEWALTRATREDCEEPGVVNGYSQLSGRRSYEDAVDSLNRLAQHLNGLRSGTRLQYELTKTGIKHKGKAVDSDETQGVEALLRVATAMFGDLVDELGPPLKALSSASTFTLNRLRDVCVESRKEKTPSEEIQPHEFSELVDGIEAALIRFESTSNHAVLRLYRRNDEIKSSSSHDPLQPIKDADNENVFLVYFFIFTLQEFSKELIFLVDAIERIYCYEQRMLRRKAWWFRLAAWTHGALSNLNFSRKKSPDGRKRTLNIRRSLAYMIPPHRRTHPAFPKIRPHAPDTVQTPGRSQLSFIGKLNQTLWTIGKRLRERDTKYAIKAGLAAAILSLPAFVDSTRQTFVEYWGDWALITFFIVISPTIGATNFLSLQRFLGTLFGAAVAVGVYTLSPEDPVALSIFGFFFSIPCSYVAVAMPKYISASRFVLLTYNLTCLFCYNVRQKDVEVIDVGILRAIAVTAGVLWAALVSRYWWPSEARREFSNSLSEFCLHIGWLYTRLVASNSFAPEYQQNNDTRGGPSNRLSSSLRRLPPTRLSNSIHEFMAMELHLQIKLIELQSLLAQAQHEPRLKGPFPVDMYRQILTSLQTILDKLHSMRCVTTREEWQGVRQDFIVPVNKERREMVGNIMLSFSTLAASFRLKAPLPPYLPPVEKSRLQLVDAIRKLDVVKNRDAKISRQLLFFAYALTMRGVTMELEFLGKTLQNAFGVIGQTAEEFEMLFLPQAESEGNIEHVA